MAARRNVLTAAVVTCMFTGALQPIHTDTADAATAADGVAAAYDFSGSDGAVLPDVSGGGQDGVLVGGGEPVGGAMLFSGANHVDLPDGLLEGRDSATIVVETSPAAEALSGNNFLWNIGGLATTSPAAGQWFVHPPRPGTQIGLSGNSDATRADSPSPLVADTWQSVTATISKNEGADTSTLTFYVDGEERATAQTGNNLSALTDHTANFIGKSAWPDPNYRGLISSFRVYDRALTPAEVVTAADDDARQVAAEALDSLGSVELPRSVVSLPTVNGAVTWASSSPSVVIRADGVTADVTLPASGEEAVMLTATATVRGQSETRDIAATLVAADPARLLAIPARISADLPGSVLGKQITWSFSEDGVVAADGTVTRPADGAVPGTLTARIEGSGIPVTAEVEVLDDGGSIATFVKTGEDDLLAYPDDRRADALHVAARAPGADTWTPLNRNQAILYVAWDGDQRAEPNNQMGSPALFRARDGSLGVVASQNDEGSGIYVWDGDGRTFSNERLLQVAGSGPVRNPSIVWDAAAQAYKVFWQDASGADLVTEFADLDAGAVPGVTLDADPYDDAPEGTLPAGALADQASALSLSSAEFDAFSKTYVVLENTGVEPITATVERGVAPTADDLPAQATMTYNDGSAKSLGVEWSADDLAAVDTSTPGEYTVTGTVRQQAHDFPFIPGRADPHIFHNPDDGYYYSTGSHYTEEWDGAIVRETSYRNIGIRRAETIEGLASAEEHVIVDPDNVEGHTYGYSGFIWAPEFHKINSTWYILVGLNRGWSLEGSFPDTMVLIPFTGTEADVRSGKMLDQAYWGNPIELPGVDASFDVTYFEQDGQGYYLIPRSASIRIVKAQMGDGVVPRTTGAMSTLYGCDLPFHQGKREGSYSETNEGIDQCVVEGPYVVEHQGEIYLSYSGGTVDKYYTLGLLRAGVDADLTDPASWTATSYPLLTSYDTVDGRIGGVPHVGGGHNSFVVDDAGNLALVYHARPFPYPHAGEPGAGGLFDPSRQTAVKSVNVRADGTLDLALTADQEVAPENRTVTATVTVSSTGPSLRATTSTRCVGGQAVVVVSATNLSDAAAEAAVSTPFGDKAIRSVEPGGTSSVAFATRQATIDDGVATLTDERGEQVSTGYQAIACG